MTFTIVGLNGTFESSNEDNNCSGLTETKTIFPSNGLKSGIASAFNLAGNNVITIPDQYYLLTCHRQENSNDKNLTEILLAMEQVKYPVIFPVHPRNKERVLKFYSEYKLKNIILTEPAGYLDSINLIKNAEMVVTDSGGVLQEAHFAQTPYVFILDIARVPDNTRFDVSRLTKPERRAILDKLNRPQLFDAVKKLKTQNVLGFEKNVLILLREFEACKVR